MIPMLPTENSTPINDRNYWLFTFAGMAIQGMLSNPTTMERYGCNNTQGISEDAICFAKDLFTKLEREDV